MIPAYNDNFLRRKLPIGHLHNMQANSDATTPNVILDIAAGECRDSTDSINIKVTAGANINASVNGLLGLDAGSLAASTWYYLMATKFSGDTTGSSDTYIMSASATAPVLPIANGFTYDTFRVFDYWVTDGSSHFLNGRTVGNGTFKARYWDTVQATALTSGSPGHATALTAIDLSASVPPIAGVSAILQVYYTPNSDGNTVGFATWGSAATVLQAVSGPTAAKVVSAHIEVPIGLNSGKAKVFYINSNSSDSTVVQVVGYRFPV